ncbi:hypothetical protein llap_3699 [Limosa lapponica baueri]|uniref:Uncharacterized protein n=1 Tax=Limosa lapponica baueri TaxID=1758121 RepID=A0A2I0UJ15_LIMLA|nr:hypothetical protein llap_3699 [Limosa lapponica baueri]
MESSHGNTSKRLRKEKKLGYISYIAPVHGNGLDLQLPDSVATGTADATVSSATLRRTMYITEATHNKIWSHTHSNVLTNVKKFSQRNFGPMADTSLNGQEQIPSKMAGSDGIAPV